MTEEQDRRQGPWTERVTVSGANGGIAYRPGEILVLAVDAERAEERGLESRGEDSGAFVRFRLDGDVLGAVEELRLAGIAAQPNHVLFAHCGGCCCRPHPSGVWSPNPFQPNPFQPNPFQPNPFQPNPFQPNPFQPNPFQPNPGPVSHGGHTSARPASAPVLPVYPGALSPRSKPSIVVLDTGLADGALRPHALQGLSCAPANVELPDGDGDRHLDPIAGHGTFIAGIIERTAPGCELLVAHLFGGFGDVDELTVADTIDAMAEGGNPPDLVNMSFGGYALERMDRLAQAVRRLQATGTVIVASAGNDATCRPSYPAAFPGVVSVGALGPYGPSTFTNYGDWVRACAPGVGIVSTFFRSWDDPSWDEHFAEWAQWSGTSFAAPAVVAALALRMREGMTGAQAVAALIDAPALLRLPDLGTVINSTPCWQVGP